jgi:hypothetical protein
MSSKNGTAVNTPAPKNGNQPNGNGNPEVKAEVKTAETTKAETIPNKVEAQRERTQRLNDLFEREFKLTESRDTLKSFRLASDENTNTLSLQDGKGTSFKTSNPVVIAAVVELVRSTVDSKLKETEEQIIAC